MYFLDDKVGGLFQEIGTLFRIWFVKTWLSLYLNFPLFLGNKNGGNKALPYTGPSGSNLDLNTSFSGFKSIPTTCVRAKKK